MTMELYNTKIKQCGNIIKVYKYEKPILRGYKVKKTSIKSAPLEISEEEREQRRIRKLFKSKSDFIDILNNNFTTKDILITLTYENEENEDIIKYNFNKFIKKIKYRFGKDIKYAYIKYKQQRGVCHYHIVIDINYIDKEILDKIWSHGRSQTSKIKNVNAIAVYMANHINKNTLDKKNYKSKVFQISKTCIKPNWVYGKVAEDILYNIPNDYKEKFNKKYNTEMYGEMDIILYEK